MPSGYGRHHVRLPRLHPYLGQVEEGRERGEASDGQRPVRAGAGGGKRVVPTQSASILARSACPSVPDDARPLCLLRHIGQLSTHTMVRLPGRGAVEEMAGATASRRRRVPVDPPQRDPQAPSASTGADRPPPLRHRERSSPVKNRMLEIGTSGSVRGGDGNIPTYSAFGSAQRRQIGRERLRVGESLVIAEELQAVVRGEE